MARFTSYVEIALGADLTGIPSTWSWTDISAHAHQPSGISISRGRPDWFSQTPPARCSLTLLNDGRFTPRNPTGAYYGRLRRNTPLRVLFVPNINSLSDAFNRTSSSSWGSADVGGAWTNAGGAASDFSVSPTNGGRHLHTAASSPHYSTLAVSILRYDVRVRVKTAALATGAALTAGVAVRFQSTSATDRYELQFNTDQTLTGRLIQRTGGVDAVNASATISGLTHSAGTWYWIRAQSGYTAARLKVWADGTTEPSTWNIDGSSGFLGNPAAGAVGCYSIRETGNTNANATLDFDDWSMVDGPRIQFSGYVDEWPTTWADASASQSYAPITCSGLLRRIQQGQVLKSALYRAHTAGYFSSGEAKAYWSMEDASGSATFASGVGGTPMLYNDMSLASDSDIAGSDPLPTGGTAAYFSGSVPAYTSSTTWAVRWVMSVPAAPSVNSGFMAWSTGGTITKWVFVLNSAGTYTMQGYNSAGADVLGASSPSFVDQFGATLNGRQLYCEANGTQNGANIDWSITIWSGDNGVGLTGSIAGTIGNVATVFHSAYPGYASSAGYTIGHVAVSNDSGFGAGTYGATGYAGERTDTRLVRLANEENIPYIFGELLNQSVQSSQLMGPQPTASLISQLREVEATEEGVLHDGKQGQVTLLPRSLRQNRAVELTQNVASGQLGWPFEARDDDQNLRNDITASRPRGSSARATDTTSVAEQGVYSDSLTINCETDDELLQHAKWRVHLGTVEELRYPSIVLNLARNPTLADDWCDADIGSRIQIVGPPSELPPDVIDVQIEGYTETFDGFEWIASLNTSPASAWQVWTLEDDDLGRLDTAGSSLLTSATAGATSLLVATESGPQWSTTAEPYDWAIAGEQVTVTTMNTNATAFVAAGTAAHADNASVTPTMPAGVQQGDLLLVLAAIRSSGTGTVNTPSGYTALVTFGNMVLLGKIHTGTESAPTISFSSGAAGDSTSAQMAAFRYAQLEVVGTATVLNGSAANVTFPSLDIPRDRCLFLTLAWKQDDWTSATGPDTEIGEPTTTLGNDQSIWWGYSIETSARTRAPAQVVPVGGAAAISRGVCIALAGDVQSCTVTRAVNGVSKAQSAGAAVSLWRPGVLAL